MVADPGGEVTRATGSRSGRAAGRRKTGTPGSSRPGRRRTHVDDLLRTGTQGAWSVTMRSMLAHSFLAAAGSVCCAACAWLASSVDVRIAELGEVGGAGGILVERAAGQDREEEVRRGGNVCCPAGEAQLDLVAGIVGRGVELVIGHVAQGGPVSQLPEQTGRGRRRRVCRSRLVVPHGHRHVRGAGLVSEPHRLGQVGAVPGAVLRAGRVGAVGLVAGGTGRQDLACRGGLAGGVEAEQLDDPGAVDGVVDGLPGLEAGERRLAGVEEQVTW